MFKHGAGFERAKHWFDILDNPQEAYKTIHVAGTSGKGSTSYFVSNILGAHNIHQGLHTSPHIFDIRERMLVDGEYPSEASFVDKVKNLVPYIRHMKNTSDGRPTYFEVTNALACQYFRDEAVDYAVMETGLGGRYDSTNLVGRTDKLAVITRLGLDHTEVLGETVEEIAWQKAGIIPWSGDVIALKPEVESVQCVLEEVAEQRGSVIHWVEESEVHVTDSQETSVTFSFRGLSDIQTSTPGVYQAENAAVAIAAAMFIAERDGWDIDEQRIKNGVLQTELPGRANIWKLRGQNILVDSAHNPQKIAAFLTEIKKHQAWENPNVVFAAKSGKQWQPSLNTISELAQAVYITQFFADKPGHLQKYSVANQDYEEYIRENNLTNVHTGYQAPEWALNDALNDCRPVIVLGSMYMLGELYQAVKDELR